MWVKYTSLVFAEFDLLLEFKLVCIHLRVEAVVFLEHTCQTPGSCINSTPVSNCFSGIDIGNYIFEMSLAERFDGCTLNMR